jgi:RecA/RadA recombinase
MMAKKTRRKVPELSEDDRIAQLFGNVANKYGGIEGKDIDKVCSGLPISTYAERYVRDSNVYITGKIEMYVGGQGSGKSSYGFHIANTFMDAGGLFFLVETENKMSPLTLKANIGQHRYESGRFQLVQCGSVDMETEGDDEDSHLQSWQEAISGIVSNLRSLNLTDMPVYILVDSLLGASGSESRKEYNEEGLARGRSTSDMARAASITRFLSNLAVDLRETNILVGFTNHGKTKIQMGGMPMGGDGKSIPGGDSIGFHCSTIMWFERGAKESDVKTSGRNVKISCFKNSFGDDTRKLKVGFRYDNVRDEEGNPILGPDNDYVRTVHWNWHAATGFLVKSFCSKENYDDKVSCAESRKLITLHNRKGRLDCEEMNAENLTMEEFGMLLEEHPEVEKKIRAFPKLGVSQYPLLDRLTEDSESSED